MLQFVVTGCGRSGTKHTTQLFNKLGIKCGHEGVFDHCAKPDRGYEADCSWLAAPILDKDHRPDLKILHQVRNPVCVIRSMMGIGSFKKPYRPTAEYAIAHMSQHLEDGGNPLAMCMKFWLYWNQIAESLEDRYPYMRYRIEDMPVFAIMKFLERPTSKGTITHAKRSVDTKANARPRDNSVTWASMVDNGIKQAIAFQAAAYGYTQADLETA